MLALPAKFKHFSFGSLTILREFGLTILESLLARELKLFYSIRNFWNIYKIPVEIATQDYVTKGYAVQNFESECGFKEAYF